MPRIDARLLDATLRVFQRRRAASGSPVKAVQVVENCVDFTETRVVSVDVVAAAEAGLGFRGKSAALWISVPTYDFA